MNTCKYIDDCKENAGGEEFEFDNFSLSRFWLPVLQLGIFGGGFLHYLPAVRV